MIKKKFKIKERERAIEINRRKMEMAKKRRGESCKKQIIDLRKKMRENSLLMSGLQSKLTNEDSYKKSEPLIRNLKNRNRVLAIRINTIRAYMLDGK